jgi:3-deoxy-D-manno-octulosonic-acid transferase
MSHVTAAGRETGEKQLPSAIASGPGGSHSDREESTCITGRFLLPLDWTWCVRRALNRIRPAILIIVETELWPNLVREAHQSGARVIIVNARLSDGSFRGYKRFRFFMRRVLENVDSVCAQTRRDAERFSLLGMPRCRVTTAGNLKFDSQPPELGPLAAVLRTALSVAGRGPVMVAGSTMAGEEELVLESWREIRGKFQQAILILAPRHPNRFDAVGQVLNREGVRFIRRTELKSDERLLSGQLIGPDVMLVDTVGELARIFELADVVFVGGSLVTTGGHNILEPAYWSKPILFGPFMGNFRDMASMFVEADAAIQVRDSAELAQRIVALLTDATQRCELGRRAKALLQSQSGITQRVMEQIDRLLAGSTGIAHGRNKSPDFS